MKIILLKAFPDDYRLSMTLYAGHLLKNLQDLNPEEKFEQLLPEPLFLRPRPMRYFSQYVCYPAQAAARKADIFHITDHSYAHLTHFLDAGKTVVTFHDAIWLKTSGGKFTGRSDSSRTFVQRLNLSGLRKAARIICDSEYGKKNLLSVLGYPEDRVRVIYPGLHPFFERAPEKKIARMSGPEKYILHVGHTGSYKNIPALFQVIKILKSSKQNVKLVKAGAAFTDEQMDLMRELDISSDVIHLGKVSDEDLPSIYKAASVLLMPSLDEGFGFPVLEAMAMGTPVIVSNRGSLPEVLGQAGFVYAPENCAGMAEAVSEILMESERSKKYILEGRKRALLFTWKSAAEKVMKVYLELDRSAR